ncbi:quinone-dependent dihydroorotate dehydrogenase [Anaeromyxobacter sp. Fw109-5]|uniref:Dihydroorotate dehydrogenase (quinone) n=1 Tax=Anaeromyxobacter sp. (strain Fw109-5) TaxID=404589 RepID=PYRD_ANADF|nr:quinone-dependent dihydroorotate dehydrogenase [Anaeromyxobacter sp. Fw109-5]A7HD76.1 RecName: Full=Dihydroorotate dehydrogenase (quinone); AltName: Full=DHOdehase; Short=DHOD; Short=DHODase; AltName: Full=Dihydroorotate oxidase [Anaeromyxobacter sp. Fw109-5]ABS26672.1 Dihydroorotate oxidase [Anaeromyxobacter sp. Fw109-5]
MIWPALRWTLFHLDPERAHRLAHGALHRVPPGLARLRRPAVPPELRVSCLGLDFDGPIGLAAGFDKGDASIAGLFALGFSHVEIGTITPRPQAGNEPPRLFRLVEHRALVNRMGFNNAGAEVCARRLAGVPATARMGPVGVNVGKNKTTPNEDAAADYLACIDRLHPYADYLVVNISSPNTPGLRQLQERDQLDALLRACAGRLRERAPGKPLLVKLAPDLSPTALDEAVDVAIDAGVSGIVATNTTLSRAGVERHPRAREAGGLSGAPLEALATSVVRRCYIRAAGRVPIVGCGGVMNAEGAYAKIRAGATLVQVYTGLVYGGPGFVRRLNDGLARLLARDGFRTVAEAVGADVETAERAGV